MPIRRLRRLRLQPSLRTLVCETRLSRDDFILPLFVAAGQRREPLSAIPGSFLLGGASLREEASRIRNAGIPAVLLFAVVAENLKDPEAACSASPENPVMESLQLLKQEAPELVLIADLCLCEYTSHGHCGILRNGLIDNDATLEQLARSAVLLAEAGADLIAPSGVMDGTVAVLRKALDAAGKEAVGLMPYSAKFHSLLYGPFKAATQSQPGESKHATHQLDVANRRAALQKIRQDIAEGADLVIVKPAMTSLDILALARQEFRVPLAAYDVSGSYRMLLDYCGPDKSLKQALMLEMLTAIKRAGADMIITYHAMEAARVLP